MEKPTLYLETSFISYAANQISGNLRIAARQQAAQEWWKNYRNKYDLYVSGQVIEEAEKGDPKSAEERLLLIAGINVLIACEEVHELTNIYFELLHLPPKAKPDAIHIAFAVHYEIDFLASCNLAHIANPVHIRKIEDKNRALGKSTPTIVTPENLLAFEEGEDQ